MFSLENVKVRDHSEDPDVDGKIISEWILGWKVVDRSLQAQDRDQLRTLKNTVMNLQVA
jgi:hypothetical protein